MGSVPGLLYSGFHGTDEYVVVQKISQGQNL